jgi:hypothetical protein
VFGPNKIPKITSFGLHLDETGPYWESNFVFEAISAVNVRN